MLGPKISSNKNWPQKNLSDDAIKHWKNVYL